MPEVRRPRKNKKRDINVAGNKDFSRLLSKDILRSFDKTTQSSAFQKTQDFLRRNEEDMPE